MKYFSKTLLTFSIVLFFSLCLIFSYDSEIEHSFIICFIELFFLSIVFILEKINIKIKGHPFHILFKIFRFFVSSFLILVIFLITYFIYEFSCRVPLINYSKTLKEVQKEDYFAVRHFPEKIPKGAKNYYCIMEDILFRDDIRFVSFKSDIKYLNEIVDKYKQDIKTEFYCSENYKYNYRLPELQSIKKYLKSYEWEKYNQETKEYTVYILKNKEQYTSGFIISKKYKEIIYFFYHN